MNRAAVLAGTVTLLAGCGAQSATPKRAAPPRLPQALAHAWARQADAIAASLAANDGCTAQAQVVALQQDVLAAVNAHRVPQRLLEPLSSGVNDLKDQITCAPPLTPNDSGHRKDKGHKKHTVHKEKGGD